MNQSEPIKLFLEKHYILIEGAAALSIAFFIKAKERFTDKNVVLIVSGAKIGMDKLRVILFKGE